MRKIDRLKWEAREAALFRGHSLGFFESLGENKAVASCQDCGMEVYVDSRPMPNGIDIHGDAVADNCH